MSAHRGMLVFPGQGSQYRGMGRDIHAEFEVVRQTYAEASDILGFDVARLSFNDPDDEISLTRNTQPALLTHEIACLRVLEELLGQKLQALVTGGHSLGEYTALVAAGSLDFGAALKLVRRRGELMGEHGEGGMLALTLDPTTARQEGDRFYCQIASRNLPEQTVVGGRQRDLDALVAHMAEYFPRKKAVPLATEGAFHTYYMVTAARLFREVLEEVEFTPPRCAVLSNYTGRVHEQSAESIRSRLFFQLFNPVDWVGCIWTALAMGLDTIIELGGGLGGGEDPAAKRPNLQSIIKKIVKQRSVDAQYLPGINVDTLRATAEALSS